MPRQPTPAPAAPATVASCRVPDRSALRRWTGRGRDSSGRYRIDYAKIPDTIAILAKELLEQEATGDRNRASSWFQKYDVMPGELKSSLAQLRSVPVDVDPAQPFPEKAQ